MISCDEFLKILVEEDGGETPERKAALREHEAACADCRELAPTLKEAAAAPPGPGTIEGMEEKVMALARAHVAKRVEPPRSGGLGWGLLLAAVLAASIGGVYATRGAAPAETPKAPPAEAPKAPPPAPPGPVFNPGGGPAPNREPIELGYDGEPKTPRERLIKADRAFKKGDKVEARKWAQQVADDTHATDGIREEARELLEKLK
ncbi:MAG TPA: hypothetical protein VFF73_41945 [Planctomycetota bacterium]|nr:hypothetical protein [Planctomycetota bacterium]